MIHITGTIIASTVVIDEKIISAVATTELPKPAVDTEEAALIETVPVCIRPATPPPAIIARDHLRNGEISVITDADTIIPAITASGDAIVSSVLSIKGI